MLCRFLSCPGKPPSHLLVVPIGAILNLTHNSNQIGTGNVSVAQEVADVQRILEASGLTYTLHSAGTTVC